MIELSYTNDITAAGLSTEQAVVYEGLLRLGSSTASALAKQLPRHLSRPLVYKVLDELIAAKLVEKHDPPQGVATFTAHHPNTISDLIESRKASIEQTKAQFASTAGRLASLYNLREGKPGVQFYEGKDGVWDVLMDSMTASEEILTYADLEAIAKYIPDLNAEYSTLREEKNVQKRGLVIDSPQARKFIRSYDGNVTHTKLIPAQTDYVPFQTITQIYDNKISYITLTDTYLIGAIITDQYIANTHKYLFESLWQLSSGEEIYAAL